MLFHCSAAAASAYLLISSECFSFLGTIRHLKVFGGLPKKRQALVNKVQRKGIARLYLARPSLNSAVGISNLPCESKAGIMSKHAKMFAIASHNPASA